MSQSPPPISDQPVLTLANVGQGYGPSPVLHGVTLQVRRGEIAALLGEPGAGKTTLLRTIAGMHTAHCGTIFFKGEDITHSDASQVVGQGMSLISQTRALFSHLSTLDNLRMGAYTRSDADGVAQDMEAVYHYFPELLSLAHQPAVTLSPQQQLMLALACALMAGPDLILLDEPCAGLPSALARDMMERVVRINRERGIAILVAEVDGKAALAIADYGYVLDQGTIIQEGTSAMLRERLPADSNISLHLTDRRRFDAKAPAGAMPALS
jgi:branched-chain amino acid transport system ATP-binding protein